MAATVMHFEARELPSLVKVQAPDTTAVEDRLLELQQLARRIRYLPRRLVAKVVILYIRAFENRTIECLGEYIVKIRLDNFLFIMDNSPHCFRLLAHRLLDGLFSAGWQVSHKTAKVLINKMRSAALWALMSHSTLFLTSTINPKRVLAPIGTSGPWVLESVLRQPFFWRNRPLRGCVQHLSLTLVLPLRQPYGNPQNYPLPLFGLLPYLPHLHLKSVHITVVEQIFACDWYGPPANGLIRLRIELEEVVRNLRKLDAESSFTFKREFLKNDLYRQMNATSSQAVARSMTAQEAMAGQRIPLQELSVRDIVTKAIIGVGAKIVVA